MLLSTGLDQETGTSYNYFRDYDPSLGRYVQSDPIGLVGGVSTYGYALGSPLFYTDEKGEYSVPGAVYGAIAGGVSGYLAGRNWQSALVGGIAGGAVGFVNPFASSAAGAAAGGFVASAAGQAASNLIDRCKPLSEALDIDYTQAAIAGITGGAARGLFNFLGNTKRSAFVYQVNQRMGAANPTAEQLSQAGLRGSASGAAQSEYKRQQPSSGASDSCSCPK